MPELPEVEVLARHLAPLLHGKTVRGVRVLRRRVIRPTRVSELTRALSGSRFTALERRGKYLVFALRPARPARPFRLLGHLGMTGRMYCLRPGDPLPKHAAVTLDLGACRFVFEDTRYFGRLTLDLSALDALGPEPLGPEFTVPYLAQALQRSSQPVKVRLLDQRMVAGVGNIYASEALHHAGIAPRLPSAGLRHGQVARLRFSLRHILRAAIRLGSTVPLDGSGEGRGLFYYGLAPGAEGTCDEQLRVYDRAGEPCRRCGSTIQRIVQSGRSTYYCPRCQRR